MQALVERMTAQLKLWSVKIDHLEAATQKIGPSVRFEDRMYVDELKALYATAQLKLEELRTAGETERAHLEDEMNRARNELDAAFKNPRQSR